MVFEVVPLFLGLAQLIGISVTDLKPLRLFSLGFIVLSVFAISFGPFIWMVFSIVLYSEDKCVPVEFP